MSGNTTRSLLFALGLAASALPAPAALLETDVARAQAMLIHEDLGNGVHVFRAPEDLDYWTSTNSVVVVNDDDVVVFDSPTRAVLDQVHAALERGVVGLDEVQAAVDVDAIGAAYAPGKPLSDDFHVWVSHFSKKAMQEALDGAVGER
jgi:hypothetical protein